MLFKGKKIECYLWFSSLIKAWQEGHGGELVLYQSGSCQNGMIVKPEFGTLALFLSEEFPHEVLTANKERYSIAGWFRSNGSFGYKVDPPQ
ncbi:2OG-Fe(II) oxygenase [Thalassotalea aquiviva]|uniref:2OG-Fe(II) oxygenase n=1 Tax=Thalassotalea aquiviva TaxID=3242415 RepID=UPI003529ED97